MPTLLRQPVPLLAFACWMAGVPLLAAPDDGGGIAAHGDRPGVFYARPGPWGMLRCHHVFLEPATAMVKPYLQAPRQVYWRFPASMAGRLPNLFREAGLPEAFSTALLDPLNRSQEDGILKLVPPHPHLLAMTTPMRQAIHAELARYTFNDCHALPMYITTASVDAWFRGSKLRPALVDRIHQLSLPKGNGHSFSDFGLLMAEARSDEERAQVLKAIGRTRTLMIRIELTPTTDVDKLIDYWTLGDPRRRKDIEPIVLSIQATEGIRTLDLSHFLPPLARSLLYTFPDPATSAREGEPDCHWTTLNFLSDDPSTHLLDIRLAASHIQEHFDPVEPPYRYGDVIGFYGEDRHILVHSCIYLADDMVFTKNGRNPFRPWVINTLEEVEILYGGSKIMRVGMRKHACRRP